MLVLIEGHHAAAAHHLSGEGLLLDAVAGKLASVLLAPVVDDLGEVVDKIVEMGGVALITADHGNADCVFDENGNPFSAHTTSPVPFLITKEDVELHETGNLGDIAPTLLELLGIEKPVEMSGKSMIKNYK